jgi:leucyl-tRNA synthetase
VLEEGLSILLRLQAPITPHLSHHLWRELEFGDEVFTAPWPQAEEAALVQQEVELVLQINGKTRGSVRVPSDASRAAIEQAALASPLTRKHIAGAAVKRVVVVPGRLVNVVA